MTQRDQAASETPSSAEFRPVGFSLAIYCAILAGLCLVVFGQTLGHDFVRYDDPRFVTENPDLAAGVSWTGIVWAFTTNRETYSIPIAWLTHLLDYQIYGLHPAGHHLTSLLFHTINTLLLFLLLARTTGARGPSFAAAALFAVHPLHVESVAWISERKDVVSTFFWLLMLLTYSSYARRPGVARYVATCLLFVLGMLAKPMVMTAPAVLLLLDFWPLRRVEPAASRSDGLRRAGRLIAEKIPFFLLAMACVALTAHALSRGTGIASTGEAPWDARIRTALVGHVFYLGKTIWPARLAVPYPFPHYTWPEAIGAGLLTAVVTVAAIAAWRRHPYFLMGWAWFLVTLLPVNGLIQAPDFKFADRYTYVPLIGVFIAVTWGGAEIWGRFPIFGPASNKNRKGKPENREASPYFLGVTAVVIAALTVAGAFQASVWRDTKTLFEHAVAATPDNPVARNNLGNEFAAEGNSEEALRQYRRAIEIDPGFAQGYFNLGVALAGLGKIDDAVAAYRDAIRVAPDYVQALHELAMLLARQDRFEDAADLLARAIRVNPTYPEGRLKRGQILFKLGRKTEAIAELDQAVRLAPADVEAREILGAVLAQTGDTDNAAPHLEEAVRLAPTRVSAHALYADVLAAQGKWGEAAAQYRKVIELEPGNALARARLEQALQKAP